MIELFFIAILSIPAFDNLLEIQVTADPMKSEYDDMIIAAAEKYLPAGYDWRLFKAQLWEESKLDPNAKSGKGAVGIAQFMPKTWTEWAVKAGYSGAHRTDPVASIFTGAMYMAYLLDKWHWPRPQRDRECLAMASYNVGFGNMLKAQRLANNASSYADIIASLPQVPRVNSRETINYVRRTQDYCIDQILGEINDG